MSSIVNTLEALLDTPGRRTLADLRSPAQVQAFIDTLAYSTDDFNRCPLRAWHDGRANCFDGALLAAACLRRLGHSPTLINMLPEPDTDDEHILAIFRQEGHFGALAKSNFAGLRFREAIYRTPRELVLSYFEDYYNVEGQKTLRAYSWPLRLAPFDRLSWEVRDAALPTLCEQIDARPVVRLLSPAMVAALSPLDTRSYQAGMLGTNTAGLYQPGQPHG